MTNTTTSKHTKVIRVDRAFADYLAARATRTGTTVTAVTRRMAADLAGKRGIEGRGNHGRKHRN